MICAVVDLSTNKVVNVIVADPAIDQPHDGTTLVDCGSNSVDTSWTWNEGRLTPPGGWPVVPEAPPR